MNVTSQMLNSNQRQAARWDNGPLLVLAGPGSGKTAVLTLRIAKLIASSPNASFKILGITFTTKAANEMYSRIRELTSEYSQRINICTFHSFCTNLLRQHGSQLDLRPNFSVITDDKDRIAILSELRNRGELELDGFEDCLKKIDIMFTHGISVDDLPQYFKNGNEEQCRELQNMFRKYLASLIQENQLDFGSMLHFTRELLSSYPRIAKQVRRAYQYVCVDEFQDTNLAQYKVLRLIAPDTTANLFVVADDDQLIFQWNGADPRRLEELKLDYRPQVIQLPENYRCPAEIVKRANRLISQNTARNSSKVDSISQSPVEGRVKLKSFSDFDNEVNGLITELNSIPRNQRETCLVIARSNKLLMEVRDAIQLAGLKAEIVSKRQDFESPPIQLMHLTLKLSNLPDSRSLLNRLCSVATQVNGITVSAEEVSARAKVESITPLRSFFSYLEESETLHSFAELGLELLCDTLDYRRFVRKSFELFDVQNESEVAHESFSDYTEDRQNWMRVSEEVYRKHGENLSLYLFLQEMDLSPKAKNLSTDCVRLQTVHTAKGVEYSNVYVIGLAEDQFPTYFAKKMGETAIQEERRNCFVAITRSSQNLYLSYARSYFGWPKQPSRFLSEMGWTFPVN